MDDHSELSTVLTQLEDLSGRITRVADQHVNSPREDFASELYEVERNLRAGVRRLKRAVRSAERSR